MGSGYFHLRHDMYNEFFDLIKGDVQFWDECPYKVDNEIYDWNSK